ncbi:MAG: hypothetical protein K0M56_02760 [Kaistella sp.]|nr:hypothetical protein [Kaistella sp.]
MRINDFKKFYFGLALIVLSYIPFSYMNHAEKFKIENCDKISGTLTNFEKTYAKGGSRQVGWMLTIKNFEFKIRIVGEYYNAINKTNFKKFIKPGAFLDIYIVKSKYNGIFEKLNNKMGIKDAVTIKCSNSEILDLKRIKDNLGHLYIINLIFGILALGFGIKNIYISIKNN